MAKETIQEAYAKGVKQLKELEELYNKSPKNGEVRKNLLNEITELRTQIAYAKIHLLKVEELEYKASEQWKDVNVAIERAANIQKTLFNYDTLRLNGGDIEEIKKLKKNIIDNLSFINPEYANIVDDNEVSKVAYGAIEKALKSSGEFSNTLRQLEQLNATIATDVFVDEHRSDSDERMARILEEKQKNDEIEKTLNDVARFKEIVTERNSNWERVCNLQGVILTKSKYSRGTKKNIRELQEDIKNREKFIKDFIYEFSQNPNYEINDELKVLIGTRDESKTGIKGASLKKPTVKQHLEPILDIEEKLKAGVSPKEEKELKEKKEKMEKRLGKKWLIKLKIDKINSRIREIKQLLKGDISLEEKKKYQEELSKLNGELGVLQKEYGEVLSEIADNVSKIVEGAEKEKKQKLDLDKGKAGSEKKDTKKPEVKNDDNSEKTPEKGTRSFTSTNNGTSMPGTSIQGLSNGNVVPFESLKNTTVSNNKNLPAVKKESWIEKLKNKFETKEEPVKEKVKPEVLFSIEVAEDVVNQKLSMFANHRIPKVEGKDFYHIIRKGDELQYVREPLTNIECTRNELVKKIKETQEKYVTYYQGLYGEQKGNPLLANPNIIAHKLIGFSNGIEKKQRILKAICSLESAMHPQEAIDILNGKDTIVFRPGINGKGEYVDLISTGYLDEGSALSQYAGKIKYKSNEPLRKMEDVVKQFIDFTIKNSAESEKIVEEINKKYDREIGTKLTMEQVEKIIDIMSIHMNPKANLKTGNISSNVEKIRENLGAVKNKNDSQRLENNVVDFPKNNSRSFNLQNDITDKEPQKYSRGKIEPKVFMSEETRKRRNADGKPTVRNVTPIQSRKDVPVVPVFKRRYTDSRDNNVIEK